MPFAFTLFTLLSRKGWWKLEWAISSCLMSPGWKPVSLGAWVTSSDWLQSWPDLSCPLGNRFTTLKLTAARWAAPQVFCTLAPVGALLWPISTSTKCCSVSGNPPPSFELAMLRKGINTTFKPSENTKHEFHYADPGSHPESQINTLQFFSLQNRILQMLQNK